VEILHEFSIQTFERLINRYLALDPYLQQHLQPLIDQQLSLEITDVGLHIHVLFRPNHIEIHRTSNEKTPDLIIQGSSIALWRLFQSDVETFASHLRDVKITGDLQLAQGIKTFFQRLEIDWEEQLSYLTGDVIAHQVFRSLTVLRAWRHEVSNNFLLNLSEYLQEEARYLPSREAVEIFGFEVDTLRDDVERLEARLERLYDQNL
jgi:ubiquinone biosynthesis accessory factor UbiJ